MSVNISFYPNGKLRFTQNLKELILHSSQLLDHAIHSESFRESVINYNWEDDQGRKYHRFHMSHNLRNSVVYNRIVSGKDIFEKTQKPDGILDFELFPFLSRPSHKAYTKPNSKRIFINVSWAKNSNELGILGNLIHEYCHNLGFGHSRNGKLVKYYTHTVPYAISRLAMSVSISEKRIDEETIKNQIDDMILETASPEVETHQEQLQKVVENIGNEIELLSEYEDLSQEEKKYLESLKRARKESSKIIEELNSSSLDGIVELPD